MIQSKWKEKDEVQYICVSKHDRPIVSLSIAIEHGYINESGPEVGSLYLLCQWLLRGTQHRGRQAFEQYIDSLGGSLDIIAGCHTTLIEIEVLTHNFSKLITELKNVLQHPLLDNNEFARLQTDTIGQLKLNLESDARTARQFFYKQMYGTHAYGRSATGKIDEIKRLTPKVCHRQLENLKIGSKRYYAFSGDITDEQATSAIASVESCFETPRTQQDESLPPSLDGYAPNRILLVDKPDRNQTHFFIGHPSISISHPARLPFKVFLNALAGPIFQARYMQEIRVKRGWSYGAYGSSDTRKLGGSLYFYTYPETKDTVGAIEVSLDIIKESLTKPGFESLDLAFSKSNLVKSFPFNFDTADKLATELLFNKLTELPDDHIYTYIEKLEKIESNHMREAASAVLKPDQFNIVVLGTAKELEKDLAKAFPSWDLTIEKFDS